MEGYGAGGGMYGWTRSQKVPGETFYCHMPEHMAPWWLGCGEAWRGCPEQKPCWSIPAPQQTGSLSRRCSLDHYSHYTAATVVTTGVSKREIFCSSYYSAIPFSSVFFTSKSILTQCIHFFVSLTDGFKDSQCCIVNNFSVAWLFPSVHISKPINSLLFSNGY